MLEKEESNGERRLNFFPNLSLILFCFKVRTTFIVFSFEIFGILRFNVMFGYYGKMVFLVVMNVRAFFFFIIKFKNKNKD